MKEQEHGILGQEIFQDYMLPLTLPFTAITKTSIIIIAVGFKR
jgi:hypothetical protein